MVRQLAACHVKSSALVVQTPTGGYKVNSEAPSHATEETRVISRSELGQLMWRNGLFREDLADPQIAARLATLVATSRPAEAQGGRPT